MTATKQLNKISIIGLGQMGRKLAQLYIDAGFEVTAWNRTKGRAADLKNVKFAATLPEAITESQLIIICVYDNNATFEMLEGIPDKQILTDKTILNVTTGSPKEASEIEAIINQHGGKYLNGAIQVAPDQMGLKDTTILLSGNENAYLQNKPFLDTLGGNLKHLGENASASSAMDLATLTWLYGSYFGLMYGVKLCQHFGLKLEEFAAIIGEVTPGYTDFFKYEIDVIQREDYSITQSPLSISVAGTKRIADTFKELNVIQEFPAFLARILEEARIKGFDNEEVAAIIKVIGNDKTNIGDPEN